jgi:tocopherol O-methyltransferase
MATASAIREHYDSLALIYRAFWGEHIHHGLFVDGNESPEQAQVKMLEHCLRLLYAARQAEVLDVGCGYGGTLVYLNQVLGCGGTGLTISPKQAQIAQQNPATTKGNLNFVVGDADTFQFPAGHFDMVWAMESSEHFTDKPKFLRNVAKTLRTQGKLLLSAWTGSMDRPRVQGVARAFLCPELWTADQYCSQIESAGMRVEHCEDLTAQVLPTWEVCLRRAHRARPMVRLLPRSAREFVEGIDIILDAYQSGDLSYTVLVARK